MNLENKFLNLVPVSKFNNYYMYPTLGSIRQLIFSNKNGFRDVVIRCIGKRLYIKLDALSQWVEDYGIYEIN